MQSVGRIAAGLHVDGDRLRLARSAGDQVVGVGGPSMPSIRPADRAVVEEPQVAWPRSAITSFASSTSTLPRNRSESSRSVCHGRCHSSRPAEVIEQQLRDSGVDQLLSRACRPRRAPLAGQVGPLTVDHHGAAGLVDVGPLAEQPGVGGDRASRLPDMITTSTPAR